MGLFDSIASVWNTSKTNDSNLKAVRETNAANAALWREQSAYNSPEAQMKRLEAAGLNPNLAYGQVAESRASNPPSMEAPHFERPEISVDESLSQWQQVKNMQTLNAKNNIEIETAKANAIKAAADADYSVYETDALKKAGMLKTDSSPLKYAVRRAHEFMDGTSKAIDRSKIWQKTMDAVSKASEGLSRTIYTRPISHRLRENVGEAENAHIGMEFDGGQ